MRLLFYMSLVSLLSLSGIARAERLITVEPVVGYEQTQEAWPSAHSHDYLFYGARATAGLRLLSAEAEYLHGVDEESFPLQSQSYQKTLDNLKVGVRSRLGPGFFTVNLRAGVQAEQDKSSQTVAGVTVSSTSLAYHAYGGAGVGIRLARVLYLEAELVAILVNTQDLSQTQYQLTGGLGFGF